MGSRYSAISDQYAKREIVLLKGLPCTYGKCSFCNYTADNTTNLHEIHSTNAQALAQVTGQYGVLEVINSASVFELPDSTLELIRQTLIRCHISVLYFEVYYGFRNRLQEIRELFPDTEIRFRMGIETFDNDFRKRVYNKPFVLHERDYVKLAKDIYAICLLVCVKGQTREMIAHDIALAMRHFRSVSINVFVNNGTVVEHDPELYAWLSAEYAHLCGHPQVELLLSNKDLGVFEN